MLPVCSVIITLTYMEVELNMPMKLWHMHSMYRKSLKKANKRGSKDIDEEPLAQTFILEYNHATRTAHSATHNAPRRKYTRDDQHRIE